MSKKQLIEAIVFNGDGHISTSGANKALVSVAATLSRALLETGSFTLPGVGVFKVEVSPGRESRNARTGSKINTPATNVVKFTPSAIVRKTVQLRPVAKP